MRFADDVIDGTISFYVPSGDLVLSIPLEWKNGLYFSSIDTMTIDSMPSPLLQYPNAKVNKAVRRPTTQRQQVEAKLWASRLGFCR